MCPSWESHQVHRIPAAVLPWQLGLIEGRLWGEEGESPPDEREKRQTGGSRFNGLKGDRGQGRERGRQPGGGGAEGAEGVPQSRIWPVRRDGLT